eukprot:10650896-Lingulodinium_polyedra.AAC.1
MFETPKSFASGSQAREVAVAREEAGAEVSVARGRLRGAREVAAAAARGREAATRDLRAGRAGLE